MIWHQCFYDDNTPNGQYISDDLSFKSDDIILNPYISTNNNLYYSFRYCKNQTMLLPIEYIYDKFINNNNISLYNIDIIRSNQGYKISTSEIWKPITLYKIAKNKYEISNMGNIRQISGKPVGVHYRCGYFVSTLKLSDEYAVDKSKPYMDFSLHRLVANEFIENPNKNKYSEINHIDGNKYNNHP